MKNCKVCNKEMAKNAKICPHCGAKNNKPIYLRAWFIVLVILVIGIAIGGNSKDEPKVVATKDKQETKETKKETKKEEGPTVYTVGDTIELVDYRVTVNSIRRDMGAEYFAPTAGNEFYYVDVTIENISDKEQIISSMLMFSIVDADGREYEQALFAQGNGNVDGTVAPDRKITGEYAVEVPVGSIGYELEFDASFLGGNQIVVKLD